jgi:hypothetical protein
MGGLSRFDFMGAWRDNRPPGVAVVGQFDVEAALRRHLAR